MLHSEDILDMLSGLAEQIFGILTKDEEILASFLSQATVYDDSLKINLFGESRVFSFRYAFGTWMLDLENDKENASAQRNGDISEKYSMKNNKT